MKTFKPEDQAEWLEFRRERLTSTELAGLHLTKTAAHWERLRQEKETGTRRFRGNQFTEWGLLREPALAQAVLQSLDSHMECNEDPQTIVVAPRDDRLCCTPDMLPVDGHDCIAELKTSGKNFREHQGHTWDEWAPDRYFLQCQLNMHYTQAEACILFVEYFAATADGFEGVDVEYRILRPNRQVISELMDTAAEWFAWLDGVRPEWMGEDIGLDQADELHDLVVGIADADKRAKAAAAEAKDLKAQLAELVGGSYAGDIAGYRVSVSTTADSTVFDAKKFKAAHPDLYRAAEFQSTRRGSTRITIKETK